MALLKFFLRSIAVFPAWKEGIILKNKNIQRILKITCILIYFCNSISFAAETSELEYKIKAMYLIRLALFVHWPESSSKSTLTICINPDDKVAEQLIRMPDKQVKGMLLEVVDIPLDSSIQQCHFLYISSGLAPPSIKSFPVVTVSSQHNFAEQGGMIEFYIEASKVKMKANMRSIDQAGIKLSSKLLRLLALIEYRESNND